MSAPTSEAVECPICGESFDPTAAGGWCTNPDCGEWQYLGEEVPEPVSEAPEADPADAEAPEDQEAAAPEGEAAAAEEPAQDPGESAGVAAPDEGDEEGDESADADAESTVGADADATVDEEAGDVVDEQADDAVDEELDGAVDEEADEAVGEPDGSKPEDVEAAAAAATATEACPECGAEVDPGDNFCANCGADLASAGPTLEQCPSCDAAVEADASFCANCGEDLEAARAALAEAAATDEPAEEADATGATTPDSLVLRARGETVSIADDQTVGREIRRIVTETGGGDDEAVRIHREHVRFVREGGEFYLVDLGDNPTTLNDRRLSKGDREPIEPGDEIGLSDVVTLTVEAP